ncbi:MAG: FkbM family methyltransferase [Ignavibacteriae bacterium]|nr:FkbM family methyltransferase [Ignavibacteriota bacterium]
MRKIIYKIYRVIFARGKFYNINKAIYNLIVKGIGINNFESDKLSGEKNLLDKILIKYKNPVIFDIGANVGNYSESIKLLSPDSTLFSFEPHPKIYKSLEASSKKSKYKAFNIALGKEESKLMLYDYENNTEGTEHASLFKETFEKFYNEKVTSYEVDVITLDKFVKENNIGTINLLKIDTEGNDYNVLLGAKESLTNGKIDIIHFEFNSMNVYSRVYFRDFFELLSNFDLYRLLPKSFIHIKKYEPIHCEIFAYQNIVAVRKDLNFKLT